MRFFIGRGKIANAVIAFAMVLLIGPLQAKAELINIQFQSSGFAFSGPAADPLLGGTWNQLTTGGNGTSGLLANSTGGTTAASVTWTGGGIWNRPNGFGSPAAGSSALMTSYLYNVGTGSQTITFDNLQHDTTYKLYIYTQPDNSYDAGGRQLTVSVNGGATQTATPSSTTASTYIPGQNYLAVTGTTNSIGQLQITYNGGGIGPKNEADINGIQLYSAPAPEPSTYVLMGIGGLLVASFRLKRDTLLSSEGREG